MDTQKQLNQGDKIKLDGILFSNSQTHCGMRRSGEWFIYDGKLVNGRYRVTNRCAARKLTSSMENLPMQKQASPLKYRDGACFHGSFTCPLLCSTKVNSSGNFVVHSLVTSSLCRSSTLRQLVSEQKSLLKLLELLLPVSSAIRLISVQRTNSSSRFITCGR